MKSKILFILLVLVSEANGQMQGSIEQLYYFSHGSKFSMGPIAQFRTNNNWYAEARYNYEELNTFSFYVGRVYEHEGALSYTLTPMFGGVVGRYQGGSAGLNMDLSYRKIFFSAQTQYTFSSNGEMEDFYYAWSELVYEATPWLYAGYSMQNTYYPQNKEHWIEPGAVVGFSHKNWTFPVYIFSPLSNDRTLILSILYEWSK